MAQAEPRVGGRYSCKEQSRMHGGSVRHTLPERNGEITLIRFELPMNPDGPHIIDHGPPETSGSRLEERGEMLRRQSEPLPVYKRVSHEDWEYLGRYRVESITDDARVTAERSEICRRPIKYVIYLEHVG